MSPQPTQLFDGKRVLITGGTGSLGKTMVRRLLESRSGGPDAPSARRAAIRDNEIRAERHVRHSVLPALLKASDEFGVTGYWFLLEGQSNY